MQRTASRELVGNPEKKARTENGSTNGTADREPLEQWCQINDRFPRFNLELSLIAGKENTEAFLRFLSFQRVRCL